MTRYIIGTIAGIDNPLTPSQKGNMAVRYYFEKTSKDELQKDRDEVLSTTADDLRNFAPLVKDVLEKDVICVFGNETLLRENEGLFGALVVLQK